MITLLSPSKAMQDVPDFSHLPVTEPQFLADSQTLRDLSAQLTVPDLMEFMEISENLAKLNFERFQTWSAEKCRTSGEPAALAFNGDVYEGLDAPSLEQEDLHFAQDHLRILSGLYGLLAPLDKILPYRLEMGRKLANPCGTNLYAFWKGKLTEHLNQLTQNDPVLINLASQEYFKAVDRRKFNGTIITPDFKEERNGKLKVISFYAKKARGLMARFIVTNRIETPEQLKMFAEDGYSFNAAESTEDKWIFSRSSN